MKEPKVILVDETDLPIGEAGKEEVHRTGQLHRAFSIFVFNRGGEMLLQQRALTKYHSGGLWTNTCCSHPEPGETTEGAALRRLQEELGFTTPVKKIFDFTYRAAFDNGLIEHEFDHVFVGEYDGEVHLNTEEVMAIRYVSKEALEMSLKEQPELYTAWFQLAFPGIRDWWKSSTKK